MKKFFTLLICLILTLALFGCAKQTGENTPDNTQTEQTNVATPDDRMLLDSGKLEIVSIEAKSGAFVERGENVQAENVTSIVIKNLSDQMLEYAKISFRVNLYERADFEISALPAGESAVVMEITARPFNEEDSFELDEASLLTAYKDAQTQSDKAVLEVEDGVISVRNTGDKAISVTFSYKYYEDGLYYGGIAFAGKFDEIPPGEAQSRQSSIFGENCRIVNVTVDEI